MGKIDKNDLWHNRSNRWRDHMCQNIAFDPWAAHILINATYDAPWDGTYTVYGLVHPKTDDLYYIGQTKYLDRRYQQHYRAPHNSGLRHMAKYFWNTNQYPIVEVFMETDNYEDALSEEERLIKKYAETCILMNREHVYKEPK